MLRSVFLFHPRLCARSGSPVNALLRTPSCSPVTCTCSCSALFSCYVHILMLSPVILLPLHAPPCSPFYTHLFMLSPVFMLHVPLHARPCFPVRCTLYSLHHSCFTFPLSHHPHHTLHSRRLICFHLRIIFYYLPECCNLSEDIQQLY